MGMPRCPLYTASPGFDALVHFYFFSSPWLMTALTLDSFFLAPHSRIKPLDQHIAGFALSTKRAIKNFTFSLYLAYFLAKKDKSRGVFLCIATYPLLMSSGHCRALCYSNSLILVPTVTLFATTILLCSLSHSFKQNIYCSLLAAFATGRNCAYHYCSPIA